MQQNPQLIKTKHSNIPIVTEKDDLKKIKVVHVENKLQLIQRINGGDAFVLINKHKHIYSRGKNNEPPWTACKQHATILAPSEVVTYSGRSFLLFGFPSGLVLCAP